MKTGAGLFKSALAYAGEYYPDADPNLKRSVVNAFVRGGDAAAKGYWKPIANGMVPPDVGYPLMLLDQNTGRGFLAPNEDKLFSALREGGFTHWRESAYPCD